MSRYHSYLNSAAAMLQQYNGEEPFASFSKRFFALYKKYGSRDRKQITHLCYCFFRLGKAAPALPVEERILQALFLCSREPDKMLALFKPGWNEKMGGGAKEKLTLLNNPYSMADLFPWRDELTGGIAVENFCASFFVQPDLFLRLRPGKEEQVKQKLVDKGIAFKNITESCIAVSNTSKLDSVIELNKEAIVQDYSSQKVGEFMLQVADRKPLSVWDCCAGSGGKSIMLYDLNPAAEITVSDIRESILVNLKKRFNEAGISKFKSVVADLAVSPLRDGQLTFDFIIADVPCSGSGTWSRTPEQLYYFELPRIDQYATLQKKIISNTVNHLKAGGYYLYITCSVFKKENEEAVDFIQQHEGLQLVRKELLAGYDQKADTLFAALLKKQL